MFGWKSRKTKYLEGVIANQTAHLEKARRLLDDYKDLTDNYQKRLALLEKQPSGVPGGEFVCVSVPSLEDEAAYQRKVMELADNSFTLFYFTQLRRSIVDEFERYGEGKAEYYRGKLAAIGDIIGDSRKARSIVLAPQEVAPF